MVKALLAAVLALAATEAAAGELARGGTGPWPAIAEVDPSLDRHVVYRPAELPLPHDRKLAVLVWGNGACSDNSEMHAAHLLEIASHGYLVLASGFAPDEARRRAESRPQPAEGQFGPAPTTAQDMTDAIDWALAQDGVEGSPYKGLIDREAIAAAGHSCGGIQALELGADPRVRAVIGNNTGILPEGASRIPGMALPKAHLGKLHQPVLYLQGGETDIAYANGMDDFRRIAHVPVAIVNLPVGHGGTFGEPNGGAAASITVDWLEWRLRGDLAAGRTFTGPNCRLCVVPDWQYEHKGL